MCIQKDKWGYWYLDQSVGLLRIKNQPSGWAGPGGSGLWDVFSRGRGRGRSGWGEVASSGPAPEAPPPLSLRSHHQQHERQRRLRLPAQLGERRLRGRQQQLRLWRVQRPRRGRPGQGQQQRLQRYPGEGLQPERPLQESRQVERAVPCPPATPATPAVSHTCSPPARCQPPLHPALLLSPHPTSLLPACGFLSLDRCGQLNWVKFLLARAWYSPPCLRSPQAGLGLSSRLPTFCPRHSLQLSH